MLKVAEAWLLGALAGCAKAGGSEPTITGFGIAGNLMVAAWGPAPHSATPTRLYLAHPQAMLILSESLVARTAQEGARQIIFRAERGTCFGCGFELNSTCAGMLS